MTLDELQEIERLNLRTRSDSSNAFAELDRVLTFDALAELIRLAGIGLEVESRKGQIRRAWELAGELHLLLVKQL